MNNEFDLQNTKIINNEITFSTLCYRYLFFEWLFMDCSRGSFFEKAAAWRHNKNNAKWLPTYMKRWIVVGAVLYAIGVIFELILRMPVISAFFYVPSVLTFPINTVISVAWIGLKVMNKPI